MTDDPYQAPAAEMHRGSETYLVSLSRRRARAGAAAWICGVLSVGVVIAGFRICDVLADRRAAAGESFDAIDQASDYLFLGILAGFVFAIVTLVLIARWLALDRSVRTARRMG